MLSAGKTLIGLGLVPCIAPVLHPQATAAALPLQSREVAAADPSAWGDEVLLELHDAGTLAETIAYHGPLDARQPLELNDTWGSALQMRAHSSLLGRRAQLDSLRYLQVPDSLRPLRNRLYRLLLARTDQAAAEGEVPRSDYDVGRAETTLGFYTASRQTVALIPGVQREGFFPRGQLQPDLGHPEIEVASLLPTGAVNILDDGIGRSTVIGQVAARLRELGREPATFGIGLTDLAAGMELSARAFVGAFEEYAFPVGFDLVYSQVGSAFYTLEPATYLAKLHAILRPGGVALLQIRDFPAWASALQGAPLEATPLFDIGNTAWLAAAEVDPHVVIGPGARRHMTEPAGLLLRRPEK